MKCNSCLEPGVDDDDLLSHADRHERKDIKTHCDSFVHAAKVWDQTTLKEARGADSLQRHNFRSGNAGIPVDKSILQSAGGRMNTH